VLRIWINIFWKLKFDFHRCEEVVLRRASADGNLEVVKYVIERGANVNVREGSPLRSAALAGHYEIVKYLVEKGSIISPKVYEFSKKNGHCHIADYLDKHFIYKKLEV
jgi:ankyrin repeat protein